MDELTGTERSAIWWRLGVVQSALEAKGCVVYKAKDFEEARAILDAEEDRLALLTELGR